MRITLVTLMLATGVSFILALFLASHEPQLAYAQGDSSNTAQTSFIDRIFSQVRGVFAFSAQVVSAVLALDEDNFSTSTPQSGDADAGVRDTLANFFIPQMPQSGTGSIIVNVPFGATSKVSVTGNTELATTTISNLLTVTGRTSLADLAVQGQARLGSLGVSGQSELSTLRVLGSSALQSLSVSGSADINGTVRAIGGLETRGADIDLQTGRIFASNVVNEIIAGSSNVTIGGTPNAPTISVREKGGRSTPSLEAVRAVGGCAECITDSDVVAALTINAGTIENTVIGSTTAAAAFFTELAVTGTATSTFGGSIDITDGCIAINGICLALGGTVDELSELLDVDLAAASAGELLMYDGSSWVNVATSTLGLGDGTFLGLGDTPSSYIANAILYANSSSTAMTQSADFVFTGTRLGIGTDSPIATLSVAGAVGITEQNMLRFYDSDNSAYIGFQATSSLLGNTVWTLPSVDGGADQILVTDGNGNLRFDDVESIGGGSDTFLGLDDTADAYIANAIPYVASSSQLVFSSDLVFDGTYLGIGTDLPTSELTVQGSVRFEFDAATPGFIYDHLGRTVAIGTEDPAERFTLEGGSMLQRGAAPGSLYETTQVGSLDMPDNANDIKIVGPYAYIVTGSAGNEFRIVNVTDSTAPAALGSLNLPASANALAVSGKYAYVVTDVSASEFQVVNISNPSQPTPAGSLNLSTTGFDVFIRGNYAYVVTGGTGDDFHVIDISNPNSPREVGSLNLPAGVNGVSVSGNYAYVTMNTLADEFKVIDISNPALPVEVETLDLPASGNEIFIQGVYAYVVTSGVGNDLHIVNISNPTSVSVVGSINLSTGGSSVYVSGEYAYVTTAGAGDDVHVVDISEPTLPVEVGSEDLSSGSALAVAVSGRYAYVVTSSIGDDLHVMDISGIEAQSLFAHSFQSGTLSTLGNAHIGGSVTLGAGIRSGFEGIQTDGSLFVQGTSSSFFLGSLGIGTTSPSEELTVQGDFRLTGRIYDTLNSAGTNGMVLQTTGTGFLWVATSTLGLGGSGVAAFTALTDVGITSFNDGRLLFESATEVTDSASLTFANSLLTAPVFNANGASTTILSINNIPFFKASTTRASIFIGEGTGVLNSQSDYDIALGSRTLSSITSGDWNIAVGESALTNLTSGSHNIALGGYAGENLTTGGRNVLMGQGAGGSLTYSSYNVAMGYGALNSNNATGSIAIGYQAGNNLTSGDNNIIIGYDIDAPTATSDNILNIGNLLFGTGVDGTGTTLSTGNIGIGTSSPSAKLTVAGTIQSTDLLGEVTSLSTDAQGNIIRTPSDSRLKTDVVTIEGALDKLLGLRGVTYQWLDTKRFGEQAEIGFIAQEVDLILPEVVSKGGEYWSLNTSNILAVVIEAFKEMWEAVQGNQERIVELEERVQLLESELGLTDESEPSAEDTEVPDDLDPADTATTTSEISDETNNPPEPVEETEAELEGDPVETQEEVDDGVTQEESIADADPEEGVPAETAPTLPPSAG